MMREKISLRLVTWIIEIIGTQRNCVLMLIKEKMAEFCFSKNFAAEGSNVAIFASLNKSR